MYFFVSNIFTNPAFSQLFSPQTTTVVVFRARMILYVSTVNLRVINSGTALTEVTKTTNFATVRTCLFWGLNTLVIRL